MRISTLTISSDNLYNVQVASERFFRAQQVMSSGKRVTQLSDDPASLPDDLNLRSAMSGLNQYKKNIDDARGFIGSADVAVGNAITLIRQARVMAVQGASDGLTGDNRQLLAKQVDGIMQALQTVANSSYGSRFIFGGQRTTQPPFAQQNGNYVYKGGTRAAGEADILIDVGPSQPEVVNKPGDEVFSSAFQALDNLRNNLQYGQPARISNDNLPELDNVLNTLTAAQADYGAKGQQLSQTNDRYDTMLTDFAGYLSNIEDADIPKSIVEMNSAQTAYQAALTASTRSFQQSLLDFLK